MKGIIYAGKNLKAKGEPVFLICIVLLILTVIVFALSIGFWMLVAALPIWIGTFIFPYTFKWVYALLAGICLWIVSILVPSNKGD